MVGLTAALGLLVLALSATHEPAPTSAGLGGGRGPDVPLCGSPPPLEQALSEVGFPVFMPHHPLANEVEVQAVEWCPPHQLTLTFASGVSILMDVTEHIDDPAELWERFAAQNSAVHVGTVRGHPAALTDPDADPTDQAPGGVQFVEEGILVDVTGNGEIPLSDLVAITESLQVVEPGPQITPTASTSLS